MLGHGRLRGEVKLDVMIDGQGHVACASAIGGNPIAISSAMAAIRNWRFKPLIQRGKAMPVLGHLTIPYQCVKS
jgi:TonB family protein